MLKYTLGVVCTVLLNSSLHIIPTAKKIKTECEFIVTHQLHVFRQRNNVRLSFCGKRKKNFGQKRNKRNWSSSFNGWYVPGHLS